MSRMDELREQIDACRPGSDDLQLPELAELARAVQLDREVAAEVDRSQRFDRCLTSALHDVSVPAGLLDRLLASTAAAESSGASAGGNHLDSLVDRATDAASEATASAPAPAPTVVVEGEKGLSRRRWLVRATSIGAIAATVLGVALLVWHRQPRTVSEAELAGDVPHWIAKTDPPAGWQRMTTTPPAALVIPKSVRGKPTGWREFRTSLGDRAVAYDFTSAGNVKVRLFVVSTPHKYLVSATPGTPLGGTTGGVRVSAWQSATGTLYVLFIDQNGPPIDQYLQRRLEA